MTQHPCQILAVLILVSAEAASAASQTPQADQPQDSSRRPPARCLVTRRGSQIQLQSPAFSLTLDTANSLRARAWKNHLTGREISLGTGPEIELDFDTAEQRIWITGWKRQDEQRTSHVFLPAGAQGKRLTLTLGGVGLYDYRQIEVAIDGQAVGTRRASNRWREAGSFDLGPGSPIHSRLRFGQDNLLVIHCRDPILRTERMDQLGVNMGLPGRNSWPAQFEQYLTVGTPLSTPQLRVVRVHDQSNAEQGELSVHLESAARDTVVRVTYRWDAKEPVLHKFVQIQNRGPSERRLMNVRLGDYATGVKVSEGEQGFPVYLEDECFLSLAHPSGWAMGQDGHVRLCQYPGRMLAPNAKFDCMEVVLGTAPAGVARQAFLQHVRQRSRRVARGHDRPYAIYETFGANEIDGKRTEECLLNEKYVLGMLDKLQSGKAEAGYQFDLCNTHFWVDHEGDLERFDPRRFPNGFTNIKARLDAMGLKPGLWIDSSWADWSIGGNPVVHSTFTHDPAYEDGFNGEIILCRATDPIRTMYSTAFRRHILEEGIRLIKCDNLRPICYNPNHPHLPGIYSTEAIQSAVIQTFHDWDEACPEVFIMLYWGYHSPWWLLYGDSIFESGLNMEASSPDAHPTLYVRDGVTLRLDQGQWWREDVPPLGKDTLGIWLSDWTWNSRIGKQRWQEGFAMDICRGSLLAQIWTDYDWLTPPERKQLAEFIALQKARPKCFDNPRFVLGNPWRQEPYGYCCSDGERAFLALNNCTWSDVSLPLKLNSAWGLPDHSQWDVYRRYPHPARLTDSGQAFGPKAAISLRPFEVVLLEVVPSGEPPALGGTFSTRPMPTGFTEPSVPVELTAIEEQDALAFGHSSPWVVLEPRSAFSLRGAVLTPQADHSLLVSGPIATPESYTIIADTDLTNLTAVRLEVLPDSSLPDLGPGRARNGNFVLSELRVSAAPLSDLEHPRPLVLQNASADFSQQGYGGWPVTAAIDGDPKTGWQVDPQEGEAHEAVFELREPAVWPGGTRLSFVLDQNTPEQHTLGRFRLSVTAAAPVPKPKSVPPWRVSGQAPACRQGGTLVVSVEQCRPGAACRGVVAGHEVTCDPVVPWPDPVSWQAWRVALEPSEVPRTFALEVNAKPTTGSRLVFKAHFVPD